MHWPPWRFHRQSLTGRTALLPDSIPGEDAMNSVSTETIRVPEGFRPANAHELRSVEGGIIAILIGLATDDGSSTKRPLGALSVDGSAVSMKTLH
jgi:hypothetical protein